MSGTSRSGGAPATIDALIEENKEQMGIFPSNWPECCPPRDAAEANGVYYRVVRTQVCCEDDFRSQAELGKAQDGDQCLRVGLSCYTDLDAALHRTKLSPGLGKFVAVKKLDGSHGKAKSGKGTHVTWWPYAGIVRHEGFQVVA